MPMPEALALTRTKPPQAKVEVVRGIQVRRTENGIPVISVHYSADPERDPAISPEWKTAARKKYSSQAAWDREQEIIDEAGGGDLVFAEVLRDYREKIVISDPAWRPHPEWKQVGGFDHGKTNPTALERAFVDFDGNIYLCGEYYVPGKNVWQHAPEIMRMPWLDRISECYADPSVFDQKTQQKDREEAKAVSELYEEQGFKILARFDGNRNELTFAERLMLHWANLDECEPSLFIVCRSQSEKPQPGLHPWDCPNLLWELMRTRKKKLTAQQLLTKNPSEEIVDKDNHARDALKYLVMSLPEPTRKSPERRIKEAMAPYLGSDPTAAFIAAQKEKAAIEREEHPAAFATNPRQRLQQLARQRNRGY